MCAWVAVCREKKAEAKRKGRRVGSDESDSDYDDEVMGSGEAGRLAGWKGWGTRLPGCCDTHPPVLPLVCGRLWLFIVGRPALQIVLKLKLALDLLLPLPAWTGLPPFPH